MLIFFDHLVLHIGREPVGLAWVKSNHHGCPPSLLVRPRLRPPQSHLGPVRSVDVVAVHLACIPIHRFDTFSSLRIAVDMTLVLGCLYASCIVRPLHRTAPLDASSLRVIG